MPNDVEDWTGRVFIQSGSVSISGTPTVAISGTINASITSGTVNVQNVTGDILSAAGSLRYLYGSNGSPVTVTITSKERALVVVTPRTGGPFTINVHGGTIADFVPYNLGNLGPQESIVVYVNPDIDTDYVVTMTRTSAGTTPWFVFADTGLPLVDLSYRGQQTIDHSLPVAIASDQPEYPVTLGARRVVDGQAQSNPAAGAVAAVTFPATTGYHWILDYARWHVFTKGVAGSGDDVTCRVLNGTTLVQRDHLILPASVYVEASWAIGPGLGVNTASGASLTVDFAAAGGANTYQVVNAAAYRVEG